MTTLDKPQKGPGLCPLCLLLILLVPPACCSCSSTQHEHNGKCCDNCPAGHEMRSRCTDRAGTNCQACPPEYYNVGNNVWSCEKCTICAKERGSIVHRPCTKSENAICHCAAGSMPQNSKNTTCLCPAGNQLLLPPQGCVPCPDGHFSSEKNQPCRPWTNCTQKGEETVKSGSRTSDVQCSTKKVAHGTPPPLPPHTNIRPDGVSLTTRWNYTLPTSMGTPAPAATSLDVWVVLIVILSILLAISAGAILGFTLQRCQKKGVHGRQTCRIPIQEEYSDSSITKTLNCEAS